MITVDPFKGSVHYAQAVSGPLEISILKPSGNGRYDELCKPFVCKDFLQDAYYSEVTGKEERIYGFHWAKGMLPNYTKSRNQVWCVRVSDKEYPIKAKKMLTLFEERFFFDPTRIWETSDPAAFVVDFDSCWTKQPIRVSFFSLLLRLAPSYAGERTAEEFLDAVSKKQTIIRTDSRYVEMARGNIQQLLERGWPEQTYEQYQGKEGTLHHGSGIVCWDGKYPYGTGRMTG